MAMHREGSTPIASSKMGWFDAMLPTTFFGTRRGSWERWIEDRSHLDFIRDFLLLVSLWLIRVFRIMWESKRPSVWDNTLRSGSSHEGTWLFLEWWFHDNLVVLILFCELFCELINPRSFSPRKRRGILRRTRRRKRREVEREKRILTRWWLKFSKKTVYCFRN